MKKNGKYRFTLQFSCDTDEQINAGELLERLGNKKSYIVVAALYEYIAMHPELNDKKSKIEINVLSNYDRSYIEKIIRSVVDEKISNLNLEKSVHSTDVNQEISEENINQMLDYLNLF